MDASFSSSGQNAPRRRLSISAISPSRPKGQPRATTRRTCKYAAELVALAPDVGEKPADLPVQAPTKYNRAFMAHATS
jgi:hypothetical protein